MTVGADRWADGVELVIDEHSLSWQVTRLGQAPSTPEPDHTPVASSSSATTGFTTVCQTTHWAPCSAIDHASSTTWSR